MVCTCIIHGYIFACFLLFDLFLEKMQCWNDRVYCFYSMYCGKNGRRNRLKNRTVIILNHNIKKSQEKSK